MSENYIINSNELTQMADGVRKLTGESEKLSFNKMIEKIENHNCSSGNSFEWVNLAARTRAAAPSIPGMWEVSKDICGFILYTNDMYYAYSIQGTTVLGPYNGPDTIYNFSIGFYNDGALINFDILDEETELWALEIPKMGV